MHTPMAMVTVKVPTESDAQALFDILHGMGVTWSVPFNGRGWHALTVQRPGQGLREHIRACFPDLRFTYREF